MKSIELLANLPVPRDLALPLPIPEPLLKLLLVIFFLVHIFFVNLMVGGTFISVWLEFMGLKKKRLDHLAYEIAKTVTVNKSLAVVMGIGPLLCISLVYTMQWYAANTLTGHAWLLIVPTVISAFLLAYLHKYKWHSWDKGGWKKLHLAIGVLMALHFLFIPLIFLSNINLMLFPDEWSKVKGFFSSLQIGNVLPRYLHFLLASLTLSSLFMVGWFGRKGYDVSALPGFSKPELKRTFYRAAVSTTMIQFLVGPLLLFTLPSVGLSTKLYGTIFSGAAIGLLVIWLLWKEIKAEDEKVGARFVTICVLFSVVVLSMGSGRHAYRETALADHKQAIKERTEAFEMALAEFRRNHPEGMQMDLPQTGEALFATCAGCHAPTAQLVGPSLEEIAKLYEGNPEGIVAWAKAPGKKRPNLPPMPPFAHLGEDNLRKIAEYMLQMAK